jgi:hypothetical protein
MRHLPSLSAYSLFVFVKRLSSPLPFMLIARSDSRVCPVWLTRLVKIAHRSLSGGNYRLGLMGMTEGLI